MPKTTDAQRGALVAAEDAIELGYEIGRSLRRGADCARAALRGDHQYGAREGLRLNRHGIARLAWGLGNRPRKRNPQGPDAYRHTGARLSLT